MLFLCYLLSVATAAPLVWIDVQRARLKYCFLQLLEAYFLILMQLMLWFLVTERKDMSATFAWTVITGGVHASLLLLNIPILRHSPSAKSIPSYFSPRGKH